MKGVVECLSSEVGATYGDDFRVGLQRSPGCPLFCPYMGMARPGEKLPSLSSLDFWIGNTHNCDLQRTGTRLTRLEIYSLLDVKLKCPWSFFFSHSIRKWKTKLLPLLLTMALECAKLALLEMMLHVRSSPPLLAVPGIRYKFPLSLHLSHV